MQDGATVEVLLRDVLDGATTGPRGIAVALQGEVVPRSQWGSTALASGAIVEVLRPVQGG